jgi:endonuclease I
MNKLTKRALSMLLALVLCLGLLPVVGAPAAAATVEYVTADGVSVGDKTVDVILNWGERGTTATFLSPNAEAFYDDNNTTYAELAALSGASDTSKVPASMLYLSLQNLMTDNHSLTTSYDATKELYQYTDCQRNDPDMLTCFYSGNDNIGPAWGEGATWNREHTWPDSKGLGGSDENDIMMLRPTSSSVNSGRGNAAYGVSEGFYNPNDPSQNAYDLRGDVARIMLYQYVRWGNTDYMWGAEGVIESAAVLLDWMEADPVDTWEVGRNDSVESITGTRNVFVDYPELAFVLLDAEIPSDMTTPSGEAMDLGYTITAVPNNPAYGTVSVSGNNINAFPAAGYEVSGYDVVAGAANITRNGNVFTVDAPSDCKIMISFSAKGAATVTYSQNGVAAATANAYVGDMITLPDYTGTVPEGHAFLGWVEKTVSKTETAPAYMSAGSKYTVSGNVTLYALYSYFDPSAISSSSSVFEKYNGVLTAGKYLLVSNGAAMTAAINNKRFALTTVSVVDNRISNPSANIIWKIEADDSGWTFYNENQNKYAAGNGTNNQGALETSINDYARWYHTTSGAVENAGNKEAGANYMLRRNADFGFALYAETTGTAVELYKQVKGTTFYSTTADSAGSVEPDTTCTVSFSIPVGVNAVAAMQCGADGITLPTAGTPADQNGYTFLGWSRQPVDNATAVPMAYYKAGEKFLIDEDVTLYALYARTTGGTGAQWTLVTDASTLKVGDSLVIATSDYGFVAGAISSQYMTHKAATFSSDKKTIAEMPADAVILTLGGSAGAWTLSNTSNQMLRATAVKKLAWSGGDEEWSISIDTNGAAIIQNGTSSYGRFLYNKTNPRFTTYTSDTTAAMLLPQLYRLSGSVGEITYTTGVKAQASLNNGAASSLTDALDNASSGDTVKLVADMSAEIELNEGVTLDLNGYTFTGYIAGGIITDSTDGQGCIVNDNPPVSTLPAGRMVLKDGNDWRIFGYTMEAGNVPVEAAGSAVYFWFDVSFNNPDAYKVIATGNSGFTVGAVFTWNGGKETPAELGSNLLIAEWARDMQISTDYSFYVKVVGLNAAAESGDLIVRPTISAADETLGCCTLEDMKYTVTIN